MGRDASRHHTYVLQRDDPHRLDDFFEEVVANSLSRFPPPGLA